MKPNDLESQKVYFSLLSMNTRIQRQSKIARVKFCHTWKHLWVQLYVVDAAWPICWKQLSWEFLGSCEPVSRSKLRTHSVKRMGLLTGRDRMLYRWFAKGKEKRKNSLCSLGLHIMNHSIHPLRHFQQKPALETFVRDIVQWPDHHWDHQIIHISIVRSYPVFNLELPFGPTLDPKP
jgi:hypothetical protein